MGWVAARHILHGAGNPKVCLCGGSWQVLAFQGDAFGVFSLLPASAVTAEAWS